ncbi:MAG: segregation and condensation protein A [Gammaproteobacteria bacterium]|nr:MAG: segregation and condensation protein A [Gammaproteobacteria bacterium]
MEETLSTEERILRIMRRVLTRIAKDTAVPAGSLHPLSDETILEMRECLTLIAARERELAEAAGRPKKERPRFIDEPQGEVVIPLEKTGLKKD